MDGMVGRLGLGNSSVLILVSFIICRCINTLLRVIDIFAIVFAMQCKGRRKQY